MQIKLLLFKYEIQLRNENTTKSLIESSHYKAFYAKGEGDLSGAPATLSFLDLV
jgi:hypothetical protein